MIRITIELEFEGIDEPTSPDIQEYLKELIENDTLDYKVEVA